MNISLTKIWNNEWALSLIAGLLLGLSFPPISVSFFNRPCFYFNFTTHRYISNCQKRRF